MDYNKKYNVIYADPPWSFKTYSDKGKDRSPEKHYSVMSFKDICNMPIDKIETLLEVFKKHINDLETNRFVKSEENIKNVQDNIDIIRENMVDVDLEEDKPKTETCNSVVKMFIGIRDTITGFFLSVYNHLFVY